MSVVDLRWQRLGRAWKRHGELTRQSPSRMGMWHPCPPAHTHCSSRIHGIFIIWQAVVNDKGVYRLQRWRPQALDAYRTDFFHFARARTHCSARHPRRVRMHYFLRARSACILLRMCACVLCVAMERGERSDTLYMYESGIPQRSRTLRLKAHRSLNWQPVFICEAFSHFAGDRFETRSRQPRINTVSTTYQHRINTVSTLYQHYTNYTDRAPRASESRLSAPGVP